MTDASPVRVDTRAAIVDAAASLLREGGHQAVTTRGVAERAEVQAPTIYRLFGDKDGLLEAVAEHVMTAFVTDKAALVAAATAADVDPLDDLISGWRTQIEFGLTNPSLFRLLSDPDRVLGSAAARRGREVLEARIHRLALAGRLRVGEAHAVDLIQAAGVGTIQTLLATPPEQRDPSLSDAMLDAMLHRILVAVPHEAPDGPATTAVTLRAQAAGLDALSEAERGLLVDWLDRVIHTPTGATEALKPRRR